jgi:hypothetical protein
VGFAAWIRSVTFAHELEGSTSVKDRYYTQSSSSYHKPLQIAHGALIGKLTRIEQVFGLDLPRQRRSRLLPPIERATHPAGSGQLQRPGRSF